LVGRIYKVLCSISGKIYIGQTTRTLHERWQRHLSSASSRKVKTHLYAAILKYGKDAFSIELVEDNILKKDLDERERFWIEYFQASNPAIGYNLTRGGVANHGGWHLSTEAKAKISKAQKGRVKTSEHRQKLSKAIKARNGDYITDEVRQRISAKVLASGANRKAFTVVSPTGEVFKVYGLRGFCKEHNLEYRRLWDCSKRVNGKTRDGWSVVTSKEV